MTEKILLIDDEENVRYTFRKFLGDAGYQVQTAGNYHEAATLIDADQYDIIFADIVLGDKSGIDILRRIKSKKWSCPVILITGYPDIDTAADAVRLGAFDYLHKPMEKGTLLRAADLALRHKALIDENERYRRNLEAIFRSIKDAIITVDCDSTILEINEAAEQLLELNRDVIGKPFGGLPMNCVRECLQSLDQAIRSKRSHELYRLESRRTDGRNLVLNVTASPLVDRRGGCLGAVIVLKDDTRTARLEHDLKERRQFRNIIGTSEKMQAVFSLIEYVRDLQSTVLITGESGTGKELVADAIHYSGNRKDKPLVKVNLSAISESLLESEMFGHVKGAFTGADNNRPGRFQLAHGGSLFLDEIGDITPRMQLSLLRVLQEGTIERLGDSTPVEVDVRIIAATNQNLREKVQRGEFRADLYYRLKIVEIGLPPLRERKEDIPLLVDHFVGKLKKKMDKAIHGVADEVLTPFMNHHWPGNVRELEHTLEHAFIVCRQDIIARNHLPPDFTASVGTIDPAGSCHRRQSERDMILAALQMTDWNKAKAARMLGMGRRTIYRKIIRYNLQNH